MTEERERRPLHLGELETPIWARFTDLPCPPELELEREWIRLSLPPGSYLRAVGVDGGGREGLRVVIEWAQPRGGLRRVIGR